MKQVADVVIVGGGVVGAASALSFARMGIQVLLLEKAELAAGASGSCCGNVEPYPLHEDLEDIFMAGYEMFAPLEEELDMDYEYRQVSSLFLVYDEPEWDLMNERVEKDRKKGVNVCLISRPEVQELEPNLKGDFCGAIYTPLAAHLNPMKFTLALAKTAERYGVKIRTQCEVTAIEVLDGRITRLETTQGAIAPGLVLNATGSWAGSFGRMIGLDIPVAPCRGQLMITEPVPPLINGLMNDARRSLWHPEGDFDPIIGPRGSPKNLFQQTKNGNLILGGIQEYCGFDCNNTFKTIRASAESVVRAQKLFRYPINRVQVIRMWAGLRPVTPDHKPIIGWDTTVDNLVHAVGHFHYGILLGPITGELVARLVVQGELPELLRGFTPERYDMRSLGEGEVCSNANN